MEHNPSREANSHSASQETPCLLRNPMVHYRLNNSKPSACVTFRSKFFFTVRSC